MKRYYVYILKCADNSYYTGITNNLERRLHQHENGYYEGSYTSSRRPVTLAYYECFHDVRNAIAFEKQLKGWSRKKKEALMRSDWDALKLLSRNYTQYGSPSGDHPSPPSGDHPSTGSG
ncbi:GIY-YIG nuclease family protein [Niabella hirudinis]|uniref:GIY-YIG nuclease family protein n=1 Tax=Niabella hirudinis TaxID=1285929 RepID=UPI003EBBEDF5